MYFRQTLSIKQLSTNVKVYSVKKCTLIVVKELNSYQFVHKTTAPYNNCIVY